MVEVAPGIDIERAILGQMDFRPVVRDPRPMDARLFRSDPMGLRQDLLELPVNARFTYDPDQNLFFVNFEGFSIRGLDQIQEIERLVAEKTGAAAGKVYAVVNYDNFHPAGTARFLRRHGQPADGAALFRGQPAIRRAVSCG